MIYTLHYADGQLKLREDYGDIDFVIKQLITANEKRGLLVNKEKKNDKINGHKGNSTRFDTK